MGWFGPSGDCGCCGDAGCINGCTPADLVVSGTVGTTGCCNFDRSGTYPLTFDPNPCQAQGSLPLCDDAFSDYSVTYTVSVDAVSGQYTVILDHRWETPFQTYRWEDTYQTTLPIIGDCPSPGTYSIPFSSRFVPVGFGPAQCPGSYTLSLVFA